MNFLNNETRKKIKSQTSKTVKKLLLQKNNKSKKSLKLPNLKGVVINNFSRNNNNNNLNKNTLSNSSNNSISFENKTFFAKLKNRTSSFNKNNIILSKKKKNIFNNSNKILSLNLQKKKTLKNISTNFSHLNTIGIGKNKNRTILNIFNTSFKNNSNIFLFNKENNLNNSNNIEYKLTHKKSNSNKNLYSINLNSIISSENNSNNSEKSFKSILTFNSPIINMNIEKKQKINKTIEHKNYLRNLKLSLLNQSNKLNKLNNNNFNINNNTNSLNNDFISYSTNLYSSNDNKFLINNNINLKNYNNFNDNNLLNNLNIEIIDKKISEKNINFLNKLKIIGNKNHNFVKDLSQFKEKIMLHIDNKIDKYLKYDSKQIYFDFFNIDKKKKEKEINKNNALKILRLNYINSFKNKNFILQYEMKKIEKKINKQKIRTINKNTLNYFINHQIIFHLISDKIIYNQILKYFNINKTFSDSAIISKTLRSIFTYKEMKNFYNFINHFKNFEIENFFEKFEYCYQKKRSSIYNNTFFFETKKLNLEEINNRHKKLQTIKYKNPSNLEKNLHFVNKKNDEHFIRKYTLKDFFKTTVKKSTLKKEDENKFCLKKNFFYRSKDKIKERTVYIKNLKFRPSIKIQNINFHVNDQQADMQKNKNMTKESLQYRTEELKMELKKSLKTIEEILFFLIKENNIREFKNILERFQVNINSTDKEKNTFLIFAVQCNSIDLVNYLIEKGSKINQQNASLNTALHYALLNQNYALADLLIKNGADEQIKNSDGLIPWQMNK